MGHTVFVKLFFFFGVGWWDVTESVQRLHFRVMMLNNFNFILLSGK